MSKLSTFREFELEDMEPFHRFFARNGSMLSIYNFANLYMWGRLHKHLWTIYQNRLIIYSDRDKFAVMPLGEEPSPGELIELSDVLIRNGKKGDFSYVPGEYIKKHPELEESFEIRPDPDNGDYIYSTKKLAELRGRKLHKKKNLLNQFLKNYPDYQCLEMSTDYFQECIDLSEKWCVDVECEIVDFAYETEALRRGFENWDYLVLDGLVILFDGNIIAFSVFNKQNENTALIHYEKFDRDIKGCAQVINWEAARNLEDDYEFVNREQDLGIEGLRKAKESYQPEFKADISSLIRKQKE